MKTYIFLIGMLFASCSESIINHPEQPEQKTNKMSVLGNNDISVTLVKNVLGESTTAVGGLCTSNKLNPWGINSPLSSQQIRCWGKSIQTAPFELGMFRGYDHLWRCYGVSDEPVIDPVLTYYEAGNIVFKLDYFPLDSDLTSGVAHVFDVFFNRYNDFSHSGHMQINDDITINDAGQYSINIDPVSPPDYSTNGSLAENSSFYLKFKHVSSPARRWDDQQFTSNPVIFSDTEPDAYIIKVNVGADVFTYETYYERSDNTIVAKYGGIGAQVAYVHVYNGNPYDVNIDMSFEINNLSDFTGAKSILSSGSLSIPAGVRSGGTLVRGELLSGISGSNALSQWNVGEAYYGRVKITYANHGTFSPSWLTGFNGVIVNTLPQ